MDLCLVTRGWVLPDMRTNKVAKNSKIDPKICRLLVNTDVGSQPAFPSVNPSGYGNSIFSGEWSNSTLPHCFNSVRPQNWRSCDNPFKAPQTMLMHPKQMRSVASQMYLVYTRDTRRICIFSSLIQGFKFNAKHMNFQPMLLWFFFFFFRAFTFSLLPFMISSNWEGECSG